MIFHGSVGNFHFALYLDSLVARLIFRLGANVKTPHPADGATPYLTDDTLRTGCHLRNLFWIAYVLDKELCIRMGEPVAIHDEDCDLSLPPRYEEQLNRLLLSEKVDQMEFEGYLYPTDLRLIKIKSRAYGVFYGPGALCKSDIDVLRSIRELDNTLEEWRLSIPPRYRPNISPSQVVSTHNPVLDTHSVIVRMDYHHCMAIIHQASGRCKAWASDQSNGVNGVSSSFALSVETSRSSLLCLQSVLHVLPNGTFWYVFLMNPLTFFP